MKISRHVSFRPIGLDYYLTRSRTRTGGDDYQSNLRYSTGFTSCLAERVRAAPTTAAPQGLSGWEHRAPVRRVRSRTLRSASTRRPQNCVLGIRRRWLHPFQVELQTSRSTRGRSMDSRPAKVSLLNSAVPAGNRARTRLRWRSTATTSTRHRLRLLLRFVSIGPRPERRKQLHRKSTLGQVRALASFQGQCGGNIQAPTFEASEGSVQEIGSIPRSAVDSANNAEQRKTVTITAKAADNRSVGPQQPPSTLSRKP
jgi:hypothetical protein